jgi:hypothetical protein
MLKWAHEIDDRLFKPVGVATSTSQFAWFHLIRPIRLIRLALSAQISRNRGQILLHPRIAELFSAL